MAKICHIVCDHGLGHLRRTIIQGHKEVLEGHQVTILSPMDKFEYLASKSSSRLPKIRKASTADG